MSLVKAAVSRAVEVAPRREAPKAPVRRTPSVRVEARPYVLDKADVIQKALAVAKKPELFAQLPPQERPQVDEVVKALSVGSGYVAPQKFRATPQKRPHAQSASVVALRAHSVLSPSSGITPPDIAVALHEQGMDFVQPFAPGTPLQPFYGYNRPPRLRDYQIGRNIGTDTRIGRIPYVTLDRLYRSYDVAQDATRHTINSLRAMVRSMTFGPALGCDRYPAKEIIEVQKRLRRPDGKQFFANWLAQNMLDLWKYDSAPIYRFRDAAGNVTQLQNVSAPIIEPMLDYYGDFPDAPAPAFQQYIQGVPWDDLTWEDLIYAPFWPETESPYGTPPLETVLMNANTDVRLQLFFLQFFTAGCYDDQTEVLTREGWRFFKDLNGSEEFATRSPEGKFEWQHTTDGKVARYDYDGDLVKFSSSGVDQLVTPNHRMLARRLPGTSAVKHNASHDWHIRRADYFLEHPTAAFQLPITSEWSGPEPERFTLPGRAADRRHPARERAVRLMGKLFEGRSEVLASEGIAWMKSEGIGEHATQFAREQLGVASLVRGKVGDSHGGHVNVWLAPTNDAPADEMHGPYTVSRGLDVPMEAFMRFLGFWIAEGSLRVSRGVVTVCQSSGNPKLPAVEALIEATGLHATRTTKAEDSDHGSPMVVWEFGHRVLCEYLLENCGHGAPNKRVPADLVDLSPRLLRALLDGLLLGDGHTTASGQLVYTTTSRVLADQVQELWQKVGVYARVDTYDPDPRTKARLVQYRVRTHPADVYRVPRATTEHYAGVVSCVSVPNTTLFVRRHGKAIWCGNSVPEALAIAPEELTSGDDLGDFEEQYYSYFQGDQSERYGLHWLPHGTEIVQYKPQQFDPDLAEYVLRRTCSAYQVMPHNIGFTDSVNRSVGDTQMDVEEKNLDVPLAGYYEALLDSVIQEDWGFPVSIHLDVRVDRKDELQEAQARQIYWQMAALRNTDVRQKLGYPVDPRNQGPLGIMDQRLGWSPMSHAIAIAGDIDEVTGMPKLGSVEPVPYELPGGGNPPPAAGPQDQGQPQGGGASPKVKRDPTKAYPRPPRNVVSKEAINDEPPNASPGYGLGLVSGSARNSNDLGFGVPAKADIPWSGIPGYGTAAQGSTAQGTGAIRDPNTPERELSAWRRQSRNRVKAGKSPRWFETNTIGLERQNAIWEKLEGAQSIEQVDAAFKAAEEPRVAGIAVRAKDTGRVLLLQRALEPV